MQQLYNLKFILTKQILFFSNYTNEFLQECNNCVFFCFYFVSVCQNFFKRLPSCIHQNQRTWYHLASVPQMGLTMMCGVPWLSYLAFSWHRHRLMHQKVIRTCIKNVGIEFCLAHELKGTQQKCIIASYAQCSICELLFCSYTGAMGTTHKV